jgi:phage tail-like protein
MSANTQRGFFFANEAQWKTCQFIQVDTGAMRGTHTVRPFTPYARPGTLFESSGAHAPALTSIGDVLWHDDAGRVYRFSTCDVTPQVDCASSPIAQATRIVTSADALWVVDPPSGVQRYDIDSFTRVLTVEIAGATIVDIAGDDRGGVMVLLHHDSRWECVHINAAGHIGQSVCFDNIIRATAFVYLRQQKRFVVLAGRSQHLYWFSEEDGVPLFNLTVAALRPCFVATALGSDSGSRVFLAGADGDQFGGARCVLILDADGNPLGDIQINPQYGNVTGVTASQNRLLVTTAAGLIEFEPASTVPDDVVGVDCIVITPVLQAPDRPDHRRWLRIEAEADLPEGTSLEISFASTDRADIRDRVNAILANEKVPESRRVLQFRSEPAIWHRQTEFHGSATTSTTRSPYSAKLFDVRDPYIWVCATLHAAPGARIPSLSKLAVLYPGRTLMEHLPAIYKAEEERPDSFLRNLVGVLETTTQTLDSRIGSMGSQIHPSTAPDLWLNFTARWLGLPWDDGMSVGQKRRVMLRAATLAKGRGTREGLEALLDALLPERPPRYRVTDTTADFGFAIVGGRACAGSTLPAMLGGSTRWNAELNSRAVLGYMRLPCPGQLEDGAWQLAGTVRVEIAASSAERRQWEPWLRTVIADMVPLTARLDLRWVSPRALRSGRLDGTMTLETASRGQLGTDAIVGEVRLPQRGVRLSSSGSGLSTRLR